MAEVDSPAKEHVGVKVLDGLIEKYYEKLCKEVDENAKIGDFLKMVELRRKLTPMDAEQKKFWEMLDTIRREVMKKAEETPKVSQRRENAKRLGKANSSLR